MKQVILAFLLCSIGLFACQTTPQNQATTQEETTKQEQSTTPKEDHSDSGIVLHENKLGSIDLMNFPKENALSSLKKAFPSLNITKEIGYQDGPDFPLYNLSDENASEENGTSFIAMNDTRTQKVDQVALKTPFFKDQYGLKVGDAIETISSKRKGKFSIFVGDHVQTYMTFENSKIRYLLDGDFLNKLYNETDGGMGQDLTVAQVEGATISRIIWWNY